MIVKLKNCLKRIIPCIILLMFLLVMYLFNSSTSPSNNPVNLPDDIVPLSDGIQYHASFYLFNPTDFSPTFTNVTPELCDFLGEGTVTFHDDVYNDPDSINQLIVKAPDYSSVVPSDMGVQWGSLYKYNDDICVIGIYSDSVVSNDSSANVKTYASVLDYGARGDGITDDSDAILAAISQNDKVFFPSGKYLVTKQIVIPNGCSLIGEEGSTIDFHNNITSGYSQGYIVNENSSWLNSSNLAHDISIKNLEITKSNLTTKETAILLLSNVENVKIDHVTFKTSYDDCVDTIDFLVNCHNIDVTNCSFYHNQGSHAGGLWIRDRFNQGVSYGTSNINFKNCYFEKNSGIDELIAIFSVPDSNKNFGSISNVNFSNCTMIRNTNSNDTSSQYNEPYFIDITMGDTNNIKFNNCTIKDYNLLVGAIKLLVHKNDSISPAVFSDCTIECPSSYKTQGESYVFIKEGNSMEQEVAHISNSTITAGKRIVCANAWINFDNTSFVLDGSVALESNNVANNCSFELSNCTQSSRAFRNGRCVINNSSIIFKDSTATQLYIQPAELNDCSIESKVPVNVQYGYTN